MCFFTNYSFFLQKTQFFYSFNNSFNDAVKIFSQRIYSFKQNANNSFKEFIHSKKKSLKENIHSCEKWIIAQGYFHNKLSVF